MTSNSTFVSAFGSQSENFKNDRMKLCFLWFDEILFEDLGRITREGFLASIAGFDALPFRERRLLTGAVSPISERVKIDWMADFKDPQRLLERHGYPRWGEQQERYDYPDPETPEQAAHNALLRKIEAEHGVARFEDGFDIMQAEGRAGAAINAIAVWREVSEQLPCVLQARRDEQDAMAVMNAFGRTDPPPTPFTLFQATIPSLAHLPWKEVATLKANGTFETLRSKLEGFYAVRAGDLTRALADLKAAEERATDEILNLSRPRPGKALVEGILSNIPFPGPNPLSIIISLKGFMAEAKKEEQFEWLYMLRDLREK